jgi:hypothetical protein
MVTDLDHPTVPWDQSAEKTKMLIALREGRIPLAARDEAGRRTTDLDKIWTTHCPNYSRKKLSQRLTVLRKAVLGELQPQGFKEPQKWENSKAYQLLEEDIRHGRVTIEPQNPQDWETIYLMRPEYAAFDHTKFAKRLQGLRKCAGKFSSRASEDTRRLDAFVVCHQVSLFSHKGYEQWQGSDAQKMAWLDISENKHLTMRKRDLYGSRREYYLNFPLKAFRDFIKQEVRTGKWKHTLAIKGKQYKAS